MFTSFEMPLIFFFFFLIHMFFFFPYFKYANHINLVISDQFFFNIKILKNLFVFLLYFNTISLVPYIFSFTSTSTVFFFSFIFWLSIFLPLFFHNMNSNLAHFLPQSSPLGLSFFMVIIEMVSMFARPLALSIRLMANITASHLLIHLFCHSLESSVWYLFFFFLLLLFLETAVAFIQAYVFTMLLSLYTAESS